MLKHMDDDMGLTDYIKTRLLNNRVEQYNTKRSYWGEDERQPRTDGINTGDTGPQGIKGDTGIGSDEEAGWKLPVDEIRTTNSLPSGVSAGYRVAIVTSSVMAIKEYNGSSWDSESLDSYSVILLKHSGGIQMYLAKSSGPVYMVLIMESLENSDS